MCILTQKRIDTYKISFNTCSICYLFVNYEYGYIAWMKNSVDPDQLDATLFSKNCIISFLFSQNMYMNITLLFQPLIILNIFRFFDVAT